jgi:lipopolysaccharide transport system ATP-binding protein
LEVGTGFHPDLSGRDNIFLNGAILGMSKTEISNKFDEIVDFAGVERYIDTPVKRYSSGMYVRLAFAVAAHLEPDILIVDEVLAVGDAEFQKKCLGKMKDVSVREGRTVLFVSHQMGSISNLCNKAILVQNGKLVMQDAASVVVDAYLKNGEKSSGAYYFNKDESAFQYYINSMKMVDERNEARTQFGTNESMHLQLELAMKQRNPAVEIGLALMDKRNNRVFTIHEGLNSKGTTGKTQKLSFELASNFLAPGTYNWIATIHIPHQVAYDLIENVCSFTVVDTGTNISDYAGFDMGVVLPQYKLTIQ